MVKDATTNFFNGLNIYQETEKIGKGRLLPLQAADASRTISGREEEALAGRCELYQVEVRALLLVPRLAVLPTWTIG